MRTLEAARSARERGDDRLLRVGGDAATRAREGRLTAIHWGRPVRMGLGKECSLRLEFDACEHARRAGGAKGDAAGALGALADRRVS